MNGVHFTNFKCFAEQYIPFKQLTLLTGLNAMGKSSAFQGILLLRQSVLQGMLPRWGVILNGPLVSLGTASEVIYRDAESDEIGIGIEDAGVLHKWLFDYSSPFDDVLHMKSEPSELAPLAVFGDYCHYLSAERLGPRAIYELSNYEVEQQHLGADGRYAVAYLNAHYRDEVLPSLYHPDAADTTVVSQLTAWYSEISPGTRLSIQPYPEIGRVTLGIGFEGDRIQTKPFSPPNVGFGLSYILPVLVAVLTGRKGTVVLVESPEAHLNPKGQVAMGRLLAQAASGGIQVIAETHSDHVLNGVRLAAKRQVIAPDDIAVHFFDRRVKSDKFEYFIESPRIDSNGRIDNWPTGFFDQWEQTLGELL